MPSHAVKRLRDGVRASEGQARNDATAGKDLRIACQHDGRHRAASGEAGDEDSCRVGSEASVHLGDHLPD